MWPWVVTTEAPPTPRSLCHGWSTLEDDAHQVFAVHMYVHHLHTDRTYPHHWKQQSAIPLLSQLFHDTRVAMFGSGSLARGTRNMSPAASRWFQWSLVTQHVPGFLPWMLFGWPLLLAQYLNLDVHLSYVAIQNLVYKCGNVPQTTAESGNTPPIHHAQYMQQSINMSIQLPSGLQCDPVQKAEVVQEKYILIGGTCMYPSVNVANILHFSKHHSYCLQSQNRGHKDRSPERHLITDDHDKWITNTTTTQYSHNYTLVPMDTDLKGVAIFFPPSSIVWNQQYILSIDLVLVITEQLYIVLVILAE